MDTAANQRVVERMWQAMSAFEFEQAGALLHDDYVCEWPQSRERIRGRENFVAVNKNYPGRWRITIERIIASGDQVATEIALTNSEDAAGATVRAVSFFTVRDGLIWRETDYWPDTYDAPAWRAQWIEPM